MTEILEQGGFKTNFMVTSDSCTTEEAAALGGTVLGLDYNVKADFLEFKIVPTMIIQGKKRKKRTVTLSREDVKKLGQHDRTLTKRMVLSFVMGQYDPLGLICPIMVRAKILL